jgi:hypothetical protein
VTFEERENGLRQRLEALAPAASAELLHVLRLPNFDRADRIGEFWGYPQSRTFAELLIDCEEDRTLRAGARRHALEIRPLSRETIPRSGSSCRDVGVWH